MTGKAGNLCRKWNFCGWPACALVQSTAMGRYLREAPPGGSFHLVTRGNRRQMVYVDDIDRSWFLALLTTVVERYEWRLLAYCLMTNHYHLTVRTPKATLSAGMQQLNGVYAQRFNWRHGFEGHLFERPFRSNLAKTDAALREFTRYTVLNPVRAGMTRKPGEWPWSSYRAAAGHVAAPGFLDRSLLYDLFDEPGRSGQAAFVEFVAEGIGASGRVLGPGPETRLEGSGRVGLRGQSNGSGGSSRGYASSQRRTTMQALWPPKPNEFEQATRRSGASRVSLGM